jgi:hypothetical protein
VAQRQKKNKGNGQSRETAGKRPRPRKGRPKPQGVHPHGAASARELSEYHGLARQGSAETVSRPSPKSTSSPGPEPQEASAAPLPGVFSTRAGRWWWRVQLPGEDKARARPLKAPGAKAATDDRKTAEQIAFEMWEHAVQDNAARQIRLESTEKIERLKAQFLDKVRHFTELVETANARIEAEERARAEAEAMLARMARADRPWTEPPGPRQPDGGPPVVPGLWPAGSSQRTSEVEPQMTPPPPPAATPFAFEGRAQTPPKPAYAEVHPASSERTEPADGPSQTGPDAPGAAIPGPAAPADPAAPGVRPTPSTRNESPKAETPPPEIPTGACECCGATGIATTHLTGIDSGQLLCPRCLAAFQADLARLDPSQG